MTLQAWFLTVSYIAASVLFILGLRALSNPETARRGMLMAAVGMALAIIGTLAHVVTWEWILIGLVVGSIAGYIIAVYTPLTALPQRTALSHAFGAMAAALVGVAEFYKHYSAGVVLPMDPVHMAALGFEVLLGGLTFTGSMMAFAKLQELMRGAPITFKGQTVVNLGILATALGLLVYLTLRPDSPYATFAFYGMIGLALLFGVMLVLPIGAADMPVVISLLNSYAGLAACATGFVLDNKVLIIAGALDGASGVVLSVIMCKAMNRSILNVLFGAFGAQPQAPAGGAAPVASGAPATISKITAEETAALALQSKLVIIVPGYGMAAAQAQHGVREFADVLKSRGVKVRYAIHPVAGRMPGHMNVLLAEARVPYDELIDMEDINPDFPHADLALVMGANDVTNPAARHNPQSPIYGMPILDVDKAKQIVVCKRSMSPGFAGIDNELYTMPHNAMLFGDAKKTAEALATAAKAIVAGKPRGTADLHSPVVALPGATAQVAAPLVAAAPSILQTDDPFYAGKVKRVEPSDVAAALGTAKRVVIIPGYGLGRAQGQLLLRDLARALASRGAEVTFVLHPFAGRMPGHMNVLLAEADVPPSQVCDLDGSADVMNRADAALIIGANDIVNPDRTGPLDGMPVLALNGTAQVFVLKRGLGVGHRGVPNALLFAPTTRLCVGDAKQSLEGIVASLK